jgi:hypothetical protein
MAAPKDQSAPGPVDKKILHDLNRRATAVQDAARGVPEALLTEYETAQRTIERALRDSSKDVREAVERAQAVSGKLAEADDEQREAFAFRKPTTEEIIAILTGRRPPDLCVCGVRDFTLPFIRGEADAAFGTESPVTTVRRGIVGWDDHSNPPPRIANIGTGNGRTINGNLDLYWRTRVPHDGIFAMRPNQERSSFPVFGNHLVRGRGWYGSK